jgi:hypothetical protein
MTALIDASRRKWKRVLSKAIDNTASLRVYARLVPYTCKVYVCVRAHGSSVVVAILLVVSGDHERARDTDCWLHMAQADKIQDTHSQFSNMIVES